MEGLPFGQKYKLSYESKCLDFGAETARINFVVEYPSPEGKGRECLAQVEPTICLKRGDTNLRAELKSLLYIEIVVNNSCRFLVTFLFLCV